MGPNMPVSVAVCESAADKCGAAIRGLLSTTTSDGSLSNNLADNLLANAKRALLKTIEYEHSPESSYNAGLDHLKSKYTVLNGNLPLTSLHHNNSGTKYMGSGTSSTSCNGNGSVNDAAHIPAPKRILYPRENVQIGWKNGRKWQVGAGMMNVGNTCYLNSTLQALFHVPAFANWLFSDDEHRKRCEESKNQGDCIICAMARTLKDSQDNHQPIKPWPVYSKLRLVCKHLVPGHQEDAHEFLRYLIEAMEKAYLLRIKNSKEFDQYTKETTPLNQILGGYLKSSVHCLNCGHVSVTFQHFEDLLLDIRKVNSIEEALETHFARERLEDMGYKCEACKKKVSATKQFSLERAPISLCIQLKRFSMMGGKINKQVTFRPKLDLSPFSSKKNTNEPLTYRLVALVTHLGASQHCGHYTAIGLTSSGVYHHFDDSCVRPISLQNVLQTSAYIMFYELEDPAAAVMAAVTPPPKLTCTVTSKTAPTSTAVSSASAATGDLDELIVSEPTRSNFIGPIRPPSQFNKSNGTITTTTAAAPTTASDADSTSSANKHVLNISSTNNINKTWNYSKPFAVGSQKSAINGILKPLPSSTSTTSTPVIRPTTLVTHHNSRDDVKSTPLPPPLVSPMSNGTHTNGHTTNGELSAKKSHKLNEHKSELASPTKSLLPSMPKLDLTIASATSSVEGKATAAVTITTTKSTNTTPLPTPLNRSNGFVKIPNGIKSRSLVPYSVDDDSSDNNNHSDDDCKTVPIIKTKAGVWQVTCTNGSMAAAAVPVTSTSAASTNGASSSRFVSSEIGSADSTVSTLMKMSHRGYGGNVPTWSNQTSNMDKEVKQEKLDELKRKREIDADADMDRGRQKKVKNNQNGHGGPSNPGFNPFQENQNQMNGGHRYHQNGGASRYYGFHRNGNNNNNNNHNSQHKQHSNFRGRQRNSYRHEGYHR